MVTPNWREAWPEPAQPVGLVRYRRALAVSRINKAVEEVRDQAIEDARQAPIPPNLRRRLQKTMKDNQWDVALYRLAAEEESES